MSDDLEGNPDDLITSSEVAQIWNQRARAKGILRKYTRRSVNYHCTHPEGNPALVPDQSTPWGNLFKRSKAWAFPITPEIGRRPVDTGE